MSRKSKDTTEKDKTQQNMSLEEYVKHVRRSDAIAIVCALVSAFMIGAAIIMLRFALDGSFLLANTVYSVGEGAINMAEGDEEQTFYNSSDAYGSVSSGDESIDNTSDVTSNDLTSPFIEDDDIAHFLGGSFYELQQKYSSSEQIVTQVSHYFVDEYLGVTYDYDNGEILSLENDGPGRMPITLAGVRIGMSFSEVDDMLTQAGVDFYPSEDYDETSDVLPMRFNAGVDNMRFEATIEFEDYVVTDIICKCKFR